MAIIRYDTGKIYDTGWKYDQEEVSCIEIIGVNLWGWQVQVCLEAAQGQVMLPPSPLLTTEARLFTVNLEE